MLKVFKSLLAAILATGIIAFGALAYNELRNYPIEFTVVEGIKEIQVYADEAMTIPLHDTLYWDSVPRGMTMNTDYWIENTGVEPLSLWVKVEPAPAGWANVSFTPGMPYNLAPGEILHFVMTTVVQVDATLGKRYYNLIFYEP